MTNIKDRILDAINPTRIEIRNYKNKITELENAITHDLTIQKTSCGSFCVKLDGKEMSNEMIDKIESKHEIRVYMKNGYSFGYIDKEAKAFMHNCKFDTQQYEKIKDYFYEKYINER